MRFRKILLASAALTLGSSLFLANNNSINVQAAETQNNTFTLHIASYVYNKSGKQVHVDELKDANGDEISLGHSGDRSIIPRDTVLKYYGKPTPLRTYIGTSSQTSNGDIKMYYSIGNGYYVNVKNVGIPNGPANLTIDHNSYVYNNKGKRVRTKTIKKYTTLNVPGKFQEISKPVKFYSEYLSSSGIKFVDWQKRQRFWLKYSTIGGKQYYRIGKNRYIKANNVRYLDGKPMYTNAKETTLTLKAGQQIVNMNNPRESGKYYKKGKKLVVDRYISTFRGYPNDFWFKTGPRDSVFFHVKGTKDNWVWGRVSEVDVKRYIEPVNLPNTKECFMQFKPGIKVGVMYDVNGKQLYDNKFYNALSTDYNRVVYYPLSVNQLRYIYVPSEKKAELFYRVQDKDNPLSYFPLVDKDGKNLPMENINTFYLKASDLQHVSGITLKPINTAAQAEQNK